MSVRNLLRISLVLLLTLSAFQVFSQNEEKGQLTGNFNTRAQFYVKDTTIGATTTQYNRELVSDESFLYLNYKFNGFVAEMRFDMFANSPLLNPQAAYTNSGIGYWSIRKDIDKLQITAGYFYDQFGSGTAFRAFEDRNIGVDYAVQGARVRYDFNDKLFIKAFAGVQKGFLNMNNGADTRFTITPQPIYGINGEKIIDIGTQVKLTVGASFVRRTIDMNSLDQIATEINSYDSLSKRFFPKANTYVKNVYLSAQLFSKFNFYYEGTFKSEEALRNPFNQQLFNSSGSVHLMNLSYSVKGFGASVQARKIQSYQFRTSPNYLLLNGLVAFLPTITKQNAYTLLARYNPASQEMGENAIQGDFVFTPKWKPRDIKNPLTVSGNFSYVTNEGMHELFHELYGDASYRFTKNFKATVGLQSVFYKQEVYEFNPNAPDVYTFTPFGEFVFKFKKLEGHSLKIEWQYLHTKADLGSFANLLAEYSISPHWTFGAGDMVNTDPVRTPGTPQETLSKEITHYYRAYGVYTIKTTRIQLGYIKQVQGMNCTGGVCRVEPAFNGVRFELSTTF